MASRQQLVEKRRKELLKRGYTEGIVELSLEWAQNSASGMANYVLQYDLSDDNDNDAETMTVKFLPRYLKDTEKYIRSFGHLPKL